MSPKLCDLPIEMTASIAKCLDVDDLFNLALTCRYFRDVIRDDNICRRILRVRS